MSNNRLDYANQILKDLYSSNLDLSEKIVYNYLRNIHTGKNELNSVNSTYFNKWITRFKDKQNIEVFVDPSWTYFCQFNNQRQCIVRNCVKIYVPLRFSHIYEGANKIFDFLEKNNIIHASKICSDIRNDDIVIRVCNDQDAKKIQNFIDNDSYIQEGMLRVNPFCFNKNGVGYAYDGMLSYNAVLSNTISKYIKYMKVMSKPIEKINISTFKEFIDKVLTSNSFESSAFLNTLRDGYYNWPYPELVLGLIKLSLSSNNLHEFYNYYYSNCFDYRFPLRGKSNQETNISDDLDYKKKLFDEIIIVTMKKYPKGYDKQHPEMSGINNLKTFFRGDIKGIIEDYDLRDRVKGYLTVSDIDQIVFNYDIPGESIVDKRDNYIKIVMLNEIIRCSIVRFGKNGANSIRRFLETGDENYITYSVDKARCIVRTLSDKKIKILLSDLGVSSIEEYMKYYYNNNGKRR